MGRKMLVGAASGFVAMTILCASLFAQIEISGPLSGVLEDTTYHRGR